MRAVNLVPADLRGAGGGPSRSGGAVYVLLGALALAVAFVTVATLLGGQVHRREAKAAALEAQATQAEARAATLTRYKALAKETRGRVDGVRKLAATRVEWAHALTELSRYVGTEVRFSSLVATASSSVSGDGGTSNPLRSALALPAVEVAGCARDQAAVARLMARVRAIDVVKRVSLSSADRGGDAGSSGGGGGGGASGGSGSGGAQATCRSFAPMPAQFNLVVFLDPAKAEGAGTSTTSSQPTGAVTG